MSEYKKMITIRNQFHGTEVNIRAEEISPGRYRLSKHQVRRAQRELCGVSSCKCGDEIGQRMTGNSPAYWVEPQLDEGAILMDTEVHS